MYYPKSQIITNLYTNGEELAYFSTKQPYVGYYWKTSNGQIFTGKTPQNIPTIKLIELSLAIDAVPNENPILNSVYYPSDFLITDYPGYRYRGDIPLPTFIPSFPTPQDYTNGKMIRYFCKKTNQTIYLEINKDTHNKLVKQDSSILYQLYQPFTLTWTLIGNREQVAKNNQNTIERISNKLNMPMLAEFLKMDFTKYYKYSEASNLYTKGNELKTVQDNKMYIGFYHIHPDKGYMVGATHILEPHAYLSPINGFSYSGPSFKDTLKPSFTSNTPPSTGRGMSSGGGMSGGGGY